MFATMRLQVFQWGAILYALEQVEGKMRFLILMEVLMLRYYSAHRWI